MIEIKAPDKFSHLSDKKVFLAGSIDMGSAEDWQNKISSELTSTKLVLLNPRRAKWDKSLKQEIDNPKFFEQVDWELSGLEAADLIVFYFSPTSKSPVTMLELGLMAIAKPSQVLVCCPEGFYRKGNIDIVCDRYNISTIDSLDMLIAELKVYDIISSS